jgi:hypothetical protein
MGWRVALPDTQDERKCGNLDGLGTNGVIISLPGPDTFTLCNVGLAGSIAESYRAPYGPCFEAHRKSYSLEGERRPIQPGRSHTGDWGDHGKYQPSGGAGVNQQTVEAERTPEPKVTGGELPFAGARGLLRAGRQ